MVTTKRQINKDRDRFGGYGDTGIIAPERDITASVPSAPVDNIVKINYIRPEAKQESIVLPTVTPKSENMYTPFMSAAAPAVERPVYEPKKEATDLPARPVRERKPLEREDLMPSIKTRASLTQSVLPEEDEEIEPVQRQRAFTSLTPKVKVMLVVYLAVALVLAIAVIVTGVSISKAASQADAIALQIAEKQAVIAEQRETIAALTDDATIRDEAIAQGMVAAGAPVYTAPAISKVEYPEATPHTNAFDKFADWFSGVIM